MNRWMSLCLGMVAALPALACTCVTAIDSDTKTEMSEASIVFRGTVVERKTLPQRVEMRQRNRYAITFRLDEYWKGPARQTIILYGMDGGTDCLGGSGYGVGKNYLVYASEQEAKDVIMEDGFFWYGWTDVLPRGAKMLTPMSCSPGGESSVVRKQLSELGKGRVPIKSD